MKKFIYMAVAAIAALSSCASDNDPVMGETGKQALTFTATMEGSATSRATYNSTEKCASWEVGDQISINGKTYNAQSAGLTTTFTAAGQEAEGSTYNAYFACTYDGETATLPAEVSETWADGKFNMPMYATSTTTNLTFKNLCGVLKITVKSDEIAAVRKIKVSSANAAISGDFTVTSDAAVLSDASAIANTLTVTYSEAVNTDETGKVFYVAVPAQTYQELMIELSADGTNFTKSMTTKSATNITVARNKIYPITFADNAAPAGPDYVEISADYDNNSSTPDTSLKWAKKNVGAATEKDWGAYFAWGETTPRYTSYTRDGENNVTFNGWKDGYEDYYSYPSYTGATLDAEHDAARANWGGTWRTPTKAEFRALHKACTGSTNPIQPSTLNSSTPTYGVYWLNADQPYLPEYTGVAGILYVVKADPSKRLFFPAASCVSGTNVWNGGSRGYYWSSTRDPESADYAVMLYFKPDDYVDFGPSELFYGNTVRAVSE